VLGLLLFDDCEKGLPAQQFLQGHFLSQPGQGHAQLSGYPELQQQETVFLKLPL
jgi:hypothetical protein